MRRFKVVEISHVHDEVIEKLLNELHPDGWELDDIRFVLREGSRRPAMAFLMFSREEEEPGLEEG